MSSNKTISTAKYAKQLFEDSLVTGVPQIFLTRNIVRKILKSIILACCLFGFVYQTTEFLKIFWNYPTVLDIDVEYPEQIEPPAITFCNLNGIKRIEFCKQNPHHCKAPSDRRKFCNKFPDICAVAKDSSGLKFPFDDAWDFENDINNEYLRTFGYSANDTIQICRKLRDRNEYDQCRLNESIHTMMLSGSAGYRNCYTIYSNIASAKLNLHSVPVPKRKEALIYLLLKMDPEEYFQPDREVGAVVAIHSPNTLVNPFFEGFVVKPSRLYTVHLKMVEEKLLPSPYETKCQDYKSMWQSRGGKGPLNQEMCIAECLYNASLRMCNCVDPNIMYHHNERFCTDDELDECFLFNASECYSVCQQPCEFTDFEYDVKERKLESPDYSSVEDYEFEGPMNQKPSVVLIFLKRPEVIIYSHRPQYEDIEVFSFLGGYVGMWLGISLIAVFDFLESVSLVFCFWIRKKFQVFTL